MWKLVTRGIRETLERRASCRTSIYSQTPGETNESEVKPKLAKEQKFLVPNIVASYNSGFCSSKKTRGPKDKKYDSKWDARRSWSEAVGWSSVLAVGWVVCQSLCLRRRLFEPSKENKWHNHLLRLHNVPLSLIGTFGLHSHHVLPVTNCVANRTSDVREECSDEEWTASRPYGPITIEEALKEAKDDYTKTHRIVMGEFELRFGVEALEEKRYKDAVKHFTTGANLSSSGSMFNLGLCHELGIGTVTDTIKAAKYYKNAADRGHPDAMYNLGVFHAQGRGGLSSNMNKARELFVDAASLGQVQAQLALDMEKNVADEKIPTSEILQTNFISRQKPVKRHSTRNLSQTSEREGTTTSEELCSKSKLFCDDSKDPVENATDTFLNSLGIQTNRHRIVIGPSDCNVPCYT